MFDVLRPKVFKYVGTFPFRIQIQNAELNYWIGPILIDQTEYI